MIARAARSSGIVDADPARRCEGGIRGAQWHRKPPVVYAPFASGPARIGIPSTCGCRDRSDSSNDADIREIP